MERIEIAYRLVKFLLENHKDIISEKYKLDNMDMQVIRDYNSKYKISMLISLKDEDNYSYVLYDFNYLEIFSRYSMQKLFDNCILSGIVAKEIPGINDKVKRK